MGAWLLIIIIYLILVFGLTYLAFYLPKRKGWKKTWDGTCHNSVSIHHLPDYILLH